MKKSNLKNKIFKYLFSFFASFFVFCLVCVVASYGISTPNYAKNIIDKSGYIELSIPEIEHNLSAVAIPGGLPEDFFEYGITDQTLRDNIYTFIDYVYQNKKYEPSKGAIYDEIHGKVFAYLEEKYPDYTKDVEENVLNLIDICVDEYMVYATPTSIRYIGNYISKITPMTKYGIIALLVFIIISVLLLILYKAEKRFYILIMLSPALMLITAPTIFLIFGGIENIGITSKPLYGFVTLFIKNILHFILFIGVALLLMSVIVAVLSYFVGKKYNKVNKNI